MSRDLLDIVLPRLAKRLDRQLRRYQAGQLDDNQFTLKFEAALQNQFAWLANQGVPEARAALAIHAALLVLSAPGLRAEAVKAGLPLEVVEYRAVRTAAADVAENYELDVRKAASHIAAIMAHYSD